MNSISIDKIDIREHKISIYYTVGGEWKRFFGPESFFWVEYDSDVSIVPKSVAVVPIMGTLLTLSWLYDAEIFVEELDKDFYESIPEFKNGYRTMYPNVDFKGSISVNKIVENKYDAKQNACLFSGGVDAFNTLISHLDEKPTLVTVWGADIAYDNDAGWGTVKKHINSVANQFDLGYEIIHTNFRKIIDEVILDRELPARTGDMWWHGFHSGTGMLTLMAPCAFCRGINRLYIASSYTKEFWGKYKCSSDPVIDNYIRYNGMRIIHDGYEFSRQDKVHRICEYAEKTKIKIPLRVCWKSKDGTNCCGCEKCYRTILGIYAEKKNPKSFGFDYDENDFCSMMQKLKHMELVAIQYYAIQRLLRKNYTYFHTDKSLRWFYKANLNTPSGIYQHSNPNKLDKVRYFYSKLPKFIQRIYRTIRRLKNRIE